MAIREIKKFPEPVLKKKTAPVTAFDEELQRLIDDMVETMYAAPGVGLAAPQVGVSKRLAVIDISSHEEQYPLIVIINPSILKSEGEIEFEEGCLSIPGFREPVSRAKKTRVKAQDAHGNWFELEGEDLLSRAIQHENDHLDGVLFIHRISPLKRDLIRRKIRRLQKAGEWD